MTVRGTEKKEKKKGLRRRKPKGRKTNFWLTKRRIKRRSPKKKRCEFCEERKKNAKFGGS